MDAASIDKLEIIENSFIQKDCKAPFLTSNTGTNLPVDLATYNDSYIGSPTRAVYYKASGETVNPTFISNNIINSSNNWPANRFPENGWQITSSPRSNNAYRVFDTDSPTTAWSVDVVANRAKPFITIKYPAPVLIKKINITISSVSRPSIINIYGCRKIRGNTIVCSNTPIKTLTSASGSDVDISTSNLYDGFKIEFAAVTSGSSTTISISNIVITTQSSGSSWVTGWPTAAISSVSDINFTKALASSNATLLTLLDNLRICYNLLDDPSKFSAYKAQTAGLKVKKYSMTVSSQSPPSYTYNETSSNDNLTEINTAMDTIFSSRNALSKLHQDKTNFYAVKRLLRAYEYIIHVYIAMKLEPGPGSTYITDAIINKLNAENNSASDRNYGYERMQKRLEETTNKYSTHLDTIDNLDVQLEDLKEDVVKEKSIKATNSNILNKNTVVYYVFLVLFIILACVLLYALQHQEDSKSKLYVGGVLVTSIVAMILIYFLNMSYLKEGFTARSVTSESLNGLIVTYLTDTVNIALLNKSDSTYKSVMHVVNKEIDRYDGINKQLKLEAAGTNDIQVDDHRNARVLQYRVYLLLQLMIILSIAMFIYLYTGENVLLFGIVLLLVLFVIYLYIMNSHGMVHTDAKKIYWGEPSIIN